MSFLLVFFLYPREEDHKCQHTLNTITSWEYYGRSFGGVEDLMKFLTVPVEVYSKIFMAHLKNYWSIIFVSWLHITHKSVFLIHMLLLIFYTSVIKDEENFKNPSFLYVLLVTLCIDLGLILFNWYQSHLGINMHDYQWYTKLICIKKMTHVGDRKCRVCVIDDRFAWVSKKLR